MKTNFTKVLAFFLFAIVGSFAVNAKVLVPFYQLGNQSWKAKYYSASNTDTPAPEDWFNKDFDDSSWSTIESPITLSNGKWLANDYSYWVRCHFTIDELNTSNPYTFFILHDDGCVAFLNGVKIYEYDTYLTSYTSVSLSDEVKAALVEGDNVLCVCVSNTGGDASMDFGLYEYEGDFQDIVAGSDVPVIFTNDATYPWTLDGPDAINGNQGKSYSSSTLSMSFYSSERVELKFDWYEYNYSSHQPLQVYIDGVLMSSTSNSSWTTSQPFFLDAGEHVVAFRDSIGSYSSSNNRSGLKNIRLRQIKPLGTAVLTENSQPMSFTNDGTWSWTIEDGYIQNGNYSQSPTASKFEISFTVDETSKLSYEVAIPKYSTFWQDGWKTYHELRIYSVNDIDIDGVQLGSWYAQCDWTKDCFVFEPGTYTLQFVDTLYASTDFYARIRNIELSNSWFTVDLATAGTLGYEVLMSGHANVLDDVEMLKIVGPMNAADWTDIMNMTNLKALDLSEAQISEIPNSAFDGKTQIQSVILPEGIARIGNYAFRGTSIRRINIPSTVQTIGEYSFISTPLQYLTFAENSQLKTISRYAFQQCASLQEVILPEGLETINYAAFDLCTSVKKVVMPNSVTTLNSYAFSSNYSMESIYFSEALTELYEWVCTENHSLKEVHLPSNLIRIDHDAFYNNYSLHEINFPSTLVEIDYSAFRYCALDSVKLPINLQWLGTDVFSNNSSLKYIEFPSYLERGNYYYRTYYRNDGNNWDTYSSSSGYRSNFRSCPNIETIVMRSATPPTIDADPFESSRAKSAITLVVPSFSVVNYKLDTYWKQFGSIIEGDDVDYWKLTSPLMLTNNRRMQGKPDIDLYYGGQLTVGGNAPFPMGQFNMFVNESNPGRLLNTCEEMTADAATTNFAVDANKWYFFTPLHDVNVADISVSNNASYVFRYYDAQNRATNGASGSWKNVDTEKLVAGQGYIFHCNTACTIIFPADADGQTQIFRTTDVTQTLTVNESATTANRSWNYIGNPYPCYFDIYYMDFTAPITVWTGSTYKAYSISDDDFVLRPMQSFFVQKPDAVDEIVFHKEGRQLTTDINHAAGVKAYNPAPTDKRSIFNIQIESGEGQTDETRVVLNPVASMSYELTNDAAKFMSFDASVPQLLTLDEEGNTYAINERPQGDGVVTLGYFAGTAGTFTISVQRADGTILLIDNETGTSVNLAEDSYTFTSDATQGINASRFTLQLSGWGTSTGVDNVPAETEQSVDAIYDLSGRKTVVNGKLPRGIYIQNGRKVVK